MVTQTQATYGSYAIGRMTTAGGVTYYYLSSYDIGPNQIISGPNGDLWFTTTDGNVLGQITTSGIITEYSGGTVGWIAAGPHSTIWLTQKTFVSGQIVEAVFVTANLAVTPDSASAARPSRLRVAASRRTNRSELNAKGSAPRLWR